MKPYMRRVVLYTLCGLGSALLSAIFTLLRNYDRDGYAVTCIETDQTYDLFRAESLGHELELLVPSQRLSSRGAALEIGKRQRIDHALVLKESFGWPLPWLHWSVRQRAPQEPGTQAVIDAVVITRAPRKVLLVLPEGLVNPQGYVVPRISSEHSDVPRLVFPVGIEGVSAVLSVVVWSAIVGVVHQGWRLGICELRRRQFRCTRCGYPITVRGCPECGCERGPHS